MHSVRRSFTAFALVNMFTVLQTWLVSVGLWLLPPRDRGAARSNPHGIGVAVRC